MRSVRALDVLFTAQSAINLLSRVVASQTGNLCRVDRHASVQEDTVDDSIKLGTSSNDSSPSKIVNVAPASSQKPPASAQMASRVLETRPSDIKLKNNVIIDGKGSSVSHIGVRQRYTKPASQFFQTLQPNSLEYTAPVSTRTSPCLFLTI